jgi:hypothetical protein
VPELLGVFAARSGIRKVSIRETFHVVRKFAAASPVQRERDASEAPGDTTPVGVRPAGLRGTGIAQLGNMRPQMADRETDLRTWLLLIRGEYLEMPGLHLTRPQVRRLWGLDQSTCDVLLETLQKSNFLRVTATGGFVLAEGAFEQYCRPADESSQELTSI